MTMRTTALLVISLLVGCANSPIAVPNNYFREIAPVEVPVSIPRSYLKTMRVYVHPSMTRAFVAPLQREASIESLSIGVAGWSARASQLIPAYEGALQTALRDRAADCTTSNPTAFADTFAFEFTLSCSTRHKQPQGVDQG